MQHPTKSDHTQSELDKQMHLVVHSMNQRHNYIDSAVDLLMVALVILELGYSSKLDMDIEPSSNSLRRTVLALVVDQH